MKIMAVDFGDARTGLAACDPTEFLAGPLGVVEEKSMAKTAQKIAEKSREIGAGLIVVGLPRNMDGSEGPRAEKCRRFAGLVRESVSVPVTLWDERRTTVSAAGILTENGTFGKKRKKAIDAVAAVVILESYMAHRRAVQNGQAAEKQED